VPDFRVHVHGRHLREPDEQAGNDAREIQRADRHRQHAAPDDHQIEGGMITASTADTAVIAIENERS
jgi:hypothetical protein